jgi:DnaJ-class molecular chaperone
MPTPDYYRILELDERATPAEVRSAFRRAALAHHPDRNGGSAQATARFKQIREAYEVLRDPARRAAYRRPVAPAPPKRNGSAAYRAGRAEVPRVADETNASLAAEVAEAFKALRQLRAGMELERSFKKLIQYLERL